MVVRPLAQAYANNAFDDLQEVVELERLGDDLYDAHLAVARDLLPRALASPSR